MKAPSFATFSNIIRNELTDSIEQIFMDINTYIFEKDHVDLEHAYIDGTKIETNAKHKRECCPKASGNRTIRMNQELTTIHQEVISNLESVHGALLRKNRSIQAEGTFGILKWNKSYKRLFRRGEKNVILELTLISCGFNLYKYHNKKQRLQSAA